jgi:hypothetical protein
LAIAARLPTMFGNRENVEDGGLMSYGIDLRASWRRVAALAHGQLPERMRRVGVLIPLNADDKVAQGEALAADQASPDARTHNTLERH